MRLLQRVNGSEIESGGFGQSLTVHRNRIPAGNAADACLKRVANLVTREAAAVANAGAACDDLSDCAASTFEVYKALRYNCIAAYWVNDDVTVPTQ